MPRCHELKGVMAHRTNNPRAHSAPCACCYAYAPNHGGPSPRLCSVEELSRSPRKTSDAFRFYSTSKFLTPARSAAFNNASSKVASESPSRKAISR